jgi:hypothetical protein
MNSITEQIRKIADDYLIEKKISKDVFVSTHDVTHLLGKIFRHIEYYEKHGKTLEV